MAHCSLDESQAERALALAGSALGFLRYNFRPARIYMGDTGSMFLGFVLATVSIKTSAKSGTTVAMLLPVIALGLPIMDTLLAVIRRTLLGRPVFRADRDHIHQLVNAMDDICDLIQDTTETLTLYDIRRITPEAARLADIAVKCAERVQEVVALLAKQDDSTDALTKTCEEIDRLESDADRVLRSAMSRLFREEQDVRELIKLKEIYELLEAITDRCEDVANLAEGISLENA